MTIYRTRVGGYTLAALLIGVLATNGAGCAPARTPAFISLTNLTNVAPIARLLVVATFPSEPRLYEGFIAALTDRLNACHIQPSIVRADPLEVDPHKRIVNDVHEFQPTAILQISLVGHTYTDDASYPVQDGTVFQQIYDRINVDLRIMDVATGRLEWEANERFLLTGNTSEVGSNLGTSIVSQLREDRVLNQCPTVAAGWPRPDPGCLLDRKAALLVAQRITDERQRVKAYANAPKCD